MIQVNPQNIRNLSGELRSLLGEDFFVKQIDSYSMDGPNFRECFIKEQNAHPLAPMWKTFLSDIAICEQKGTLQLNSNSFICLNLLMYLSDLRDVKNFNRILKDLTINEKFYSTFFEARIASEYRSKGYNIEIQDENRKAKGQICDFVIPVNETNIFIECKSLNDLHQVERKLWNELYVRITNMLEKKSLGLNVEIYLGREINSKDVNEICSLLNEDINTVNLENRYLSDKTIIIKKEIINEQALNDLNKSLLINVNETGMGEQIAVDKKQLGQMAVKQMRLASDTYNSDSAGRLIYKFKMLPGGISSSTIAYRVSIYPHAELNLTKRILSNIKKASKQVPENEMGIVHIAVPNSISKNLVEIVDNSYNEILKNLQRSHSRINAVVLYGQFFERNPWGPFLFFHHIVPNFNSKQTLPKEFVIIGVEDANIEIFPDKGTLVGKGTVDSMWLPGVTCRIFHHSTHDGSCQLKLFSLPNNKIRLEIVTPIIGRQYVENEESVDLVPGGEFRFAARWGEGNISMFIHGKKVGNKDF